LNKNALIIDNDNNVISVLKSILEFNEFMVEIAEEISSLDVLLESNNPDIVIAEIMYPNLNVLDLAYQLSDKGIPMVVIGIKTLGSDERKALFCNQVPFLQKPISPVILIEKVKELVNET